MDVISPKIFGRSSKIIFFRNAKKYNIFFKVGEMNLRLNFGQNKLNKKKHSANNLELS